ncbi:MAG: hypothetical protein BV456_11755 [Thermoplasmata archaeon M8B2D]|nr:MAG: hypothetical protein BV456_11755 [Thermoplasmata archaeon M8B2D]
MPKEETILIFFDEEGRKLEMRHYDKRLHFEHIGDIIAVDGAGVSERIPSGNYRVKARKGPNIDFRPDSGGPGLDVFIWYYDARRTRDD